MEADQLGRLRDILEASRLIASYMKDTSEAQFRADTQKQDAVVRRIEIIGEATALSDETRREIAALPFTLDDYGYLWTMLRRIVGSNPAGPTIFC